NFPRHLYSRLSQELLLKASSLFAPIALTGETKLQEEMTTSTLTTLTTAPITTETVTVQPVIITESSPTPSVPSTIIITSPTVAIIF
ncbi:MAG: hypothetical protein N2246_03720, partial [Candidatus Sumerlaeia bacterium]|nr:hypothetical protein [Candidatus Sumerlaeia bacterium]